jgi:hypothetical protein
MFYDPIIPNHDILFSPIGIVAGDAPERSVETLLRIKNPGGGAATSNEAGKSAHAPLETTHAHPHPFPPLTPPNLMPHTLGISWGKAGDSPRQIPILTP